MKTPKKPAATPKPIRRTGQLPAAEVDLSALVTTVAEAWQNSELPALLWLSKAALTELAATYAAGRSTAEAVGDQRPPQARRLQALDRRFDRHLKFVKGYLAEAHDDNKGRAYYPEFGIEGKKYRLPTARPARVAALHKLLKALPAHGFGANKYGLAFWQPLVTEYAKLVDDSTDTAGEHSEQVHTKNSDEEKVRKALRALIHHIKANYPDSFEALFFGRKKAAATSEAAAAFAYFA